MSDEPDIAAEGEAPPPKKKKLMPLLLGLVLAAVFGGGGFYATYSGMLLGGGSKDAHAEAGTDEHGEPATAGTVFVPIDPILVSLSRDDAPRHLRFRGQIEADASQQAAIVAVMPRILDALNSYLRAVSTEDLEKPTALIRLRAQMLRRIQLVVGDLEIRDFLVTEFVLN